MNAAIESAIRGWLAGNASLSGIPIHAGSDTAQKDPDKRYVLVSVPSMEGRGGTLWIANVEISAIAPALSQSVADHRTLGATLKAIVKAATGLSSAFSGSGYTYAGQFFKDSIEAQDDTELRSTVVLAMGIKES